MKQLALRYGLYLFIGFTAIFLISHLFGQSDNVNLRILNGVVHMGVLYALLKAYREKFPRTINNYVSGTAAAVYACLVGVGSFAIFLILFLALDPDLFSRITAQISLGKQLTPIFAGALVFMEGLAVSVIGGYIMTRFVDAQKEKNNESIKYTRRG